MTTAFGSGGWPAPGSLFCSAKRSQQRGQSLRAAHRAVLRSKRRASNGDECASSSRSRSWCATFTKRRQVSSKTAAPFTVQSSAVLLYSSKTCPSSMPQHPDASLLGRRCSAAATMHHDTAIQTRLSGDHKELPTCALPAYGCRNASIATTVPNAGCSHSTACAAVASLSPSPSSAAALAPFCAEAPAAAAP